MLCSVAGLRRSGVAEREGPHPWSLSVPPFTQLAPTYGMALFSAKRILHGKGGNVFEMIEDNFL